MSAVPLPLFRVVLDTNILVRGLINETSPSGRILRASELRRMIPLLSGPVLYEYRDILTNRGLATAYPILDSDRIETALQRLRYVADVFRGRMKHFDFPRDPKDEKLLSLAITGKATHLITSDADLLDLAGSSDDPATQLRKLLPKI